MPLLSEEERRKIIETLEKDKEFRYTIMGLLGFRELLERFTRLEKRQLRLEERQAKLEERQQRLEERQQRLEERQARLEERQQRLEERQARLEERQQKLEERFTRLEERQARLEERQQRLEERQLKLEERMMRLEEEMRETRRILSVIAHRFGVLTEVGFRETMKYVIEEIFGVGKVDKWIYYDEKGTVYGYPSTIEVDLLIKDDLHILIEVKSRISRGDITTLYRKGLLYKEVKKVEPKLVILGGFIDRDAYEASEKLNVEIKPIVKE